ncbi:hypothetical protein BurJ1DRAFT_1829 [Burkholderiales bacterium JOSHI_001]|nr:hypothetical protein BurJ1DRAFT_1829 [Burkholderiales bacterium JOSHI_001]
MPPPQRECGSPPKTRTAQWHEEVAASRSQGARHASLLLKRGHWHRDLGKKRSCQTPSRKLQHRALRPLSARPCGCLARCANQPSPLHRLLRSQCPRRFAARKMAGMAARLYFGAHLFLATTAGESHKGPAKRSLRQERCLTLHSTRAPTAGRACPACAKSAIVAVMSCPASCRARVNSNVRPHGEPTAACELPVSVRAHSWRMVRQIAANATSPWPDGQCWSNHQEARNEHEENGHGQEHGQESRRATQSGRHATALWFWFIPRSRQT